MWVPGQPQQDGAGDPTSLVCQAQGDTGKGQFDLGAPGLVGTDREGEPGPSAETGADDATPVEPSWAERPWQPRGVTGRLGVGYLGHVGLPKC